jgi:hypothetical protein
LAWIFFEGFTESSSSFFSFLSLLPAWIFFGRFSGRVPDIGPFDITDDAAETPL